MAAAPRKHGFSAGENFTRYNLLAISLDGGVLLGIGPGIRGNRAPDDADKPLSAVLAVFIAAVSAAATVTAPAGLAAHSGILPGAAGRTIAITSIPAAPIGRTHSVITAAPLASTGVRRVLNLLI